MNNPFTKHPREVEETYLEHMAVAIVLTILMLLGGLACLVHAIFPFVFVNTATNIADFVINYRYKRV